MPGEAGVQHRRGMGTCAGSASHNGDGDPGEHEGTPQPL